jgi:hypothetical protein
MTKYGDMIPIHPKVCSSAAIGMLSPHYLSGFAQFLFTSRCRKIGWKSRDV